MKTTNDHIDQAVKDLQAGRNEGPAFKVIYDEYYVLVVRFFLRKGLDQEESRDLAQECFRSLYRGIRSFRRDASISTYLYRIMDNIFKNLIRKRETEKRRGRPTSLSSFVDGDGETVLGGEVSDDQADPLEELIQRDCLERVLDCIERLPPMPRRCLLLHVWQGRSYKEISELLGIKVGTVGAHIFEARKRLREMLAV